MTTETIERALYVVGESDEDGPACWLDLIFPIDSNDRIRGRVMVLLGRNYYTGDSAVVFSAIREAWLEPDESEVLRPSHNCLPIVSGWIEVNGQRVPAYPAPEPYTDRIAIPKVGDAAVVTLLQSLAEGGLPTLGLRLEGDQADRVFRVANPAGRRAGAAILAQINIWRWRTSQPGGVAPASKQPNE